MLDVSTLTGDPRPGAATIDESRCERDRRGPGRPRSTRADEAIIDAVVALLMEGVAAEVISIEAVAARAGVGKATIYRRWSTKDSLLVDVLASLKGPLPEVAGVSVRDDLRTLLRPVGQTTTVHSGALLSCLLTDLRRSPTLHECYRRIIEPRRELMRQVLRRGITEGVLRPDLDIEAVMAMLVAPMLAETMLPWYPDLDRETLLERLLDTLWPAITA
jgi:AcrR family transcriptional regulator